MKIALILTTFCAATILGGCATYRGGTADDTGVSSDSDTKPIMGEPSLPQDTAPNSGPAIPPP